MSPVAGVRPEGAGACVSAFIWAVRDPFASGWRLEALPKAHTLQSDVAVVALTADALQHGLGIGGGYPGDKRAATASIAHERQTDRLKKPAMSAVRIGPGHRRLRIGAGQDLCQSRACDPPIGRVEIGR